MVRTEVGSCLSDILDDEHYRDRSRLSKLRLAAAAIRTSSSAEEQQRDQAFQNELWRIMSLDLGLSGTDQASLAFPMNLLEVAAPSRSTRRPTLCP